MKYFQCRLHRETSENPEAKYIMVAWIEEKGAKPGFLVELKGEEGLWHVDSVDPIPVDAKYLTEKQNMDRRSLTSITGKQK